MKKVLMIAFHYPPYRGSSGLQRTLSFSRYLPREGWNPVVLTVKPSVYSQTGDDQLGDVPITVPVERAFALDTQRHLAAKGRYFKWMALPDLWMSWFFWAVPLGLRLIRKHKPKIIWSTYPIATAHLIALTLHRLTGLPWVADFRDPMTEFDPRTKQQFPTDPVVWRARRWIERLCIKYSSRMVFVTSGACRIYVERYPQLARNQCAVIANGYEEEVFAEAERAAAHRPLNNRPVVLLHSGALYPTTDRDPSAFFRTLVNLRRAGKVSCLNLNVILRATGYDNYYRELIRRNDLEDIVSLVPAIPYREALAEMLDADGLLIFQGYTSNPAVPAKLYEYLRAQRPIFALVDSEGDTAKLLRQIKIGTMVPLDSESAIANGLLEFLEMIRTKNPSVLDLAAVQTYSREYRAKELATLLNSVDR
jgi:glycosyltransferase involved in cell wall biosynthesis